MLIKKSLKEKIVLIVKDVINIIMKRENYGFKL